ncbi:peptide deformylase [Parendozoicomonas haliclonae]|uniref:Peptide deformylase n=1 Tax=Parendozoicomonas haliclonae TaxID=1960125 RepID=A0A1X7AJB5_9GAMM|nr:peptide deformylase [Parendozoicomonas haliclonae]SMA45856.1 Peptide deformylase [Parendozoicomonas haliclonae]
MERLSENPDIVLVGHPLLFQIQPSVSPDDLTSETFQHNLEILKASQLTMNGVGIAAPQLGWAARVITFGIPAKNPRYPDADAHPVECWINPEIVWASEEKVWTWEGCLSVPGFRGWVERPEAIRLIGLDRNGQPKEKELDGFMARVVQHELDHLDGRLYPSRVRSPEWMVPLPCFEQQDSWVENWPTAGAHKTRPGGISSQP